MKKIFVLALPLIFISMVSFAENLAPMPNSQSIAAIRKIQPGGKFTFALMGDVQGSKVVFPKQLELAAKMGVDFIIINGDVVQTGAESEYPLYLEQVRQSPVPVISLIGNHEVLVPQGHERFTSLFGPAQFSFEAGGWRFVVLDSGDYKLTPDELQWLDAELGASCPRCVVITHTPPAQSKWAQSFKEGAAEFESLLQKHKAPYAFFSHMHFHDRLKKGETQYVVCGGAGAQFGVEDKTNPKYFDYGGAYHGFVYVTVEGDKISDALVRPFLEPENIGGIKIPGK